MSYISELTIGMLKTKNRVHFFQQDSNLFRNILFSPQDGMDHKPPKENRVILFTTIVEEQ